MGESSSQVGRVVDDDGFNTVHFRRALGWLALGLGVVGIYCLFRSDATRRQADTTPRITCEQLIQNGPGAERYRTLTDAWLSAGKSVAERDSETNALAMYHPVYASHHNAEPPPRDLKLILCILDEHERRRIRDARNAAEQQGRRELGELTGAVSKANALPRWARSGLGVQYPGIRLDDCWFVTVGDGEPTAARAEWLLLLGLGCALAALALGGGWWVWRRRASAVAAPNS
jgi:hypothetical protein